MRARTLMLLFLIACQLSFAQSKLFSVHYDTEDGLPQKSVMNIIQDSKGFMWFSTWDGICKFDGVKFYAYKIRKEESRHMHSDRFDGMWLDKYGYIWANTYENEMYRFDPRTERFLSLKSVNQFKKLDFITHGITINPSGKKWLLNPKYGCICFKDSLYQPYLISKQNHQLNTNHINSVYETPLGTSWLLTDNGLYAFSPNLKQRKLYFTNKQFYCALSVDHKTWFGSDDGTIYIYDEQQQKFDTYKTGATTPVNFIKIIDQTLLLITTANNDFFIFNKKDHQLHNYKLSVLRSGNFTRIKSCYVDRSANIWLQTDESGVSKLTARTGQFKHYEINIKQKTKDLFAPRFYIWEDINNRLWIQPNGSGLGLYDPVADRLTPFSATPVYNGNIQPMLLHTGFSDRQGNLWVSARSPGLSKILFNATGFQTTHVDPDTSADLSNEVRSIMEDHLGRMWVATKAGKLFIYNPKKQQLGYLTKTGNIAHTGAPLDGVTYTMTEDSLHRIWIGTKGKGMYKLLPGTNTGSFRISHYQNNKADAFSLSDDRVYSIYADKKGHIWAGTYGGGLNLMDDKIDGRFYNYKNKLSNYPFTTGYRVRIVTGDSVGNVYAGTPLGLLVVKPQYNNPSQMRFKNFERSPAQGSLCGNDIYDVYTTKKGETYIASFGGGLNKVISRNNQGFPVKFANYTTDNGLNSNLVQQIEEDKQHKLWLISESAVSRFDPDKQLFETYHDASRMTRGEVFSEGGDTRLKDGTIMLGYSDGMMSIDPVKIGRETFTPYVALTTLRVANKELPISDSSVLKQNIDYLPELKLGYRQNFVSIAFASLDFKNTRQINYAYKLDGIDSDWVYTQQREASYSNLSPGRYIFHVKSTNGYGRWVANEHQLVINITPAIWETGWAWLLYVVSASLLIFFSLRWTYRYFRLKDRLLLEQQQTEMKTNFFTDVSHEIRTPLTMIVSPLEHLLEEETLTPEVKQNLQLMHKNTTRMLRLVNQVLDFRKTESQILVVREINIGELVADITPGFQSIASAKGINLTLDNRALGATAWVDTENFEKLAYNLLSNALKNTTHGDTVTVEIFLQHAELVLRVSDSGCGMSNELLQNLFNRFISHNTDKNQPSTGIGLSIVKETVERHHAKIAVESTEQVGSTFSIFFQCGYAHFKEDKNVVLVKADQPLTDQLSLAQDQFPDNVETGSETENNTILVIEDDDNLRAYIAGILRPYYQVIEATNGEDAMNKSLSEIPDFILSDIMMPGMDGLSFLKQLRNNPATSHIPLVFLTARADQETELTSYSYGAEAFMTKPFSTKVLRSRIKTILDQRKRLFEFYANRTMETPQPVQPPKTTKLTRLDEQFIKKIRTEIENHVAQNDYTIEELIATTPMSRTVFVKKLKSLTGQSPVEFMRYVRMHYAAELLEKEHYSIKEVSHMIGIADTKYFAQRFKEVIGVMPSEYKGRFK